MLNVSFVCFLGPEECFSGEGWDRSLNSSVHSLSSHRLCSNMSRSRLVSMVVTHPGCLER